MNEKTKNYEVDPIELSDPDVLTIFEIIKNGINRLKDKTSVILWSSLILLILWGPRGYTEIIPIEWLRKLLHQISWRDQLISFILGFILLVVIPCCIIKFYFKEKLSDYGLGWSNSRIKLGVLALIVTLIICMPIFYFGTNDPAMQDEYPLFRDAISTWGGFLVYEIVYFLFFLSIEFIFRGYLLFGLYGPLGQEEHKKPLLKLKKPKPGPNFGIYAVLFQMLPYTAWHFCKPMPEYIGTIFWGVPVALIALKTRSIWPIIIVHWLLNVWVDFNLWPNMP
jgi:membrane protease YdiL (CAAX protease family)